MNGSLNRGAGRSLSVVEPLEPRAYFAVDLADSVSIVAPASRQVKPGQAVTLAVEVFNEGDTAAAGKLAVEAAVSANLDGSSPFGLVTISKNIKIAAGGHTTLKVPVKIPAGLTPGEYLGVAGVDPNDTFDESSLANNGAVSANAVTVLGLYPNLVGTSSGTGKITKGTDKGLTFTQVDTVTSEDPATGGFAGSGTNLFLNGSTIDFTFAGTISKTGVIIASGSDVPLDDAGFFHDKEKLTGTTIRATFVNAINSGTITLHALG